ncbi:hypothetical protein J6TS2_50700 [Heyndrickxia sporothermodurans]|nr:hypothetical protein J6TS2_50700 [Heyndrickxia sporothermodurans]
MKEKTSILLDIGLLMDQHEGVISECKGCSICTDIRKLGKKLEELEKRTELKRNLKVKEVLAKGINITTSDIIFLKDEGVRHKDIAKALKMTLSAFNSACKSLGLATTYNVQRNTIKQAEYNQLKRQGLTDEQIVELKGIEIQTIINAKRRWREKINKIELSLTPSEYLKLKKSKKTDQDIAEQIGINRSYLAIWKRQNLTPEQIKETCLTGLNLPEVRYNSKKAGKRQKTKSERNQIYSKSKEKQLEVAL